MAVNSAPILGLGPGQHRPDLPQESGLSNDAFLQSELIRVGGIDRQRVLEEERQRRLAIERQCRDILQEIGLPDLPIPPMAG